MDNIVGATLHMCYVFKALQQTNILSRRCTCTSSCLMLQKHDRLLSYGPFWLGQDLHT